MNKNNLLRILSFILIFFGVILLALPRINQWRIGNRSEKNHEIAIEMPAETMKQNQNTEAEFDFASIEEVTTTGTWLSPEVIDQSLIIGRLYIPSIEANLTIFNGITNDILHAGVGTMRPNLTMGEGNFPIAGHYSRNKDVLFGDLISVAVGDEIFLTDNETVYEYQVFETRIVEPSEVKWIEDAVSKDRGKPIVSLMNCYYVNGKNSGDRYFVFGELVGTHNIDDISL